MKYLVAYGISAVVFLVIDAIWLIWIAKGFYAERLGDLLLDRPIMVAAGIFYATYVIGIVVFAVASGLRDDSALTALTNGVLFGLLAYATYDMTNLATLKGWPLSVTVVDIAWGGFITGTTAYLGYIGTKFLMA